MKICYIANGIELPYRNGLGSGGSTHVYEIAKGLHKLGHNVNLVCRRSPGQSIKENFDGIIIYRMFRSSGSLYLKLRKNKLLWGIVKVPYYVLKLVIEVISLALFLKRNSCEIVYERSSASTKIRSLLYFIFRLPLILEVNDYCDYISIKMAKAIITPNKIVLPLFVQHKTKELPWGANIEIFRPNIDGKEIRRFYNLEEKKVALIVCSGLAWHGLGELIDAAKLVTEEIDNVVFMVVGGGSHLIEYEKKIQAKGLKDKFVFIGSVDYSQVPMFISAADITLAPYNSLLNQHDRQRALYASPLKVFEYMACAKPVIITHVGNKSNIIENLKTGIVIKEDSPEDLADAILYLFKNKDLRDYLGKNAREVVEHNFSWQSHVEELNKILQCF